MNDAIVYRPYKAQAWVLIFVVPVGILAWVGAGYCLSFSCICFLCLAGIGMTCICLTKVFYDASKRAVIFEQKGLRFIGGSYLECRYIPWEELIYGCYTRNYKRHLFLVLSSNVLSSKEAKHFANQGANSSRICIGNVVVIYLDILQDISQIKELIDNHITVQSYTS